MSSLSTHVLDTAMGRPAAGITVALTHDGTKICAGVTDVDGRYRSPAPVGVGDYELKFSVDGYFAEDQRKTFYREIVVAFRVESDSEHYHVPLLLSPFGYATYRGS